MRCLRSVKLSVIHLAKVAGAFFNPSGMTKNSKTPDSVRKAAFCWSSFFMGICQKPETASSAHALFFNLAKNASIIMDVCPVLSRR